MSARVIRFKTLLVALLAPSGPNRADDSDLLAPTREPSAAERMIWP